MWLYERNLIMLLICLSFTWEHLKHCQTFILFDPTKDIWSLHLPINDQKFLPYYFVFFFGINLFFSVHFSGCSLLQPNSSSIQDWNGVLFKIYDKISMSSSNIPKTTEETIVNQRMWELKLINQFSFAKLIN